MSTLTQLDLFGDGVIQIPHAIPIQPGKFAIHEKVSVAISRALDSAKESRPVICTRITALTGKRLPLSILNCWSAMSRPDHIPNLLQAIAFDAVTERLALLRLFATSLGYVVITGDDIIALEMGRVELAKLQVKRQLRLRNAYLKKAAGVQS